MEQIDRLQNLIEKMERNDAKFESLLIKFYNLLTHIAAEIPRATTIADRTVLADMVNSVARNLRQTQIDFEKEK